MSAAQRDALLATAPDSIPEVPARVIAGAARRACRYGVPQIVVYGPVATMGGALQFDWDVVGSMDEAEAGDVAVLTVLS